jgi:YVTN family beta-propeller protein
MIATLAAPEGLVFADGQVWVAHFGHEDQADGALSRIDASTNKVVTTITVGKNPSFVAAAGGSVWVSMYGESTVVQVDATTTAVLGRLTVRGPSFGIAAGEHAVWVVQPNEQGLDSGQPGTVTRIAFQD